MRIYNDTEYGLSMAVITEDYRAMRFFRDECEYGMGYVNLPCIGAEVHLPFGGVKKSGNGHPSAAGLIEAVTHKTAWTVNSRHGGQDGPGIDDGDRGRADLIRFRLSEDLDSQFGTWHPRGSVRVAQPRHSLPGGPRSKGRVHYAQAKRNR